MYTHTWLVHNMLQLLIDGGIFALLPQEEVGQL